jgi:filamentous hemagglutinin family protein
MLPPNLPPTPAIDITNHKHLDTPKHINNVAPPEMLLAQAIVPEANSTNTQVLQQGNQVDITGGSRSADGSNLFHSFTQFNLDAGQIANFQANPGLLNILGRINGGQPSLINGVLQITGGTPNLYLMNPAGILFGANAQLNLPAAFTATTATSLGFGNQLFQGFGNNDYLKLVGNPDSFVWQGSQAGAIVNAGNLTVGTGQSLNLLGGTIVSTGKLTANDGKVTIATVPGNSRLRLNSAGNILGVEVAASSPSPLFTSVPLPQLITGGNLTDANGVVVKSDGTVQITGSNVNIQKGDASIATIKTGGALFQVDRNLFMGSLTAPNDPTIRASGDVNLGNYQGASLHILAGGQVTAGDINIQRPDVTGNGLVENVTVSDGTIVAIDGNQRPTLDIRAGTTGFNPTGIFGTGVTPTLGSAATGSGITIGNITIGGNNGQVLLTNQYLPNLSLIAGAVSTGNIAVGSGNTITAGNVAIDSRSNITVGNINASGIDRAGTVNLLASNNLLFGTINATAQGGNNPVPGIVNLFANGTIRGIGGDANTPTIVTQGILPVPNIINFVPVNQVVPLPTIPGAINITHNGGPNNQPFIVGNASLNGTAGTIVSGANTVPTVTSFAAPTATPVPNVNINFNNQAPTLTAPSRSLNTNPSQPLQITFADLQALVQDVDGDNTTLRVAAIGPGSLTRNGAAVAPGSIINPGDVLRYTPSTNATGAVNAFSIQANDGIANSAAVAIPVNIRIPPTNVIPEIYPNRSLPPVQFSDYSQIFVPKGEYLAKTTRINDLQILSRILPEHLMLVDLIRLPKLPPNFSAGCKTCISLPPSGGNIGLVGLPGYGSKTIPMILIIPDQPNPSAVSPAIPPDQPNPSPPIPPGQPNPPGPIAVNPNPNPTQPPVPGTPGTTTLPDCQTSVGEIKRQRVADRVDSFYVQLRKCYEQQLSAATTTKQKTLQTYALNNLATTSYVLGDYLKAIDYHQQQVKIAQSENNTIAVGMAYGGIGAAYGALGDYRQAIQFYEQALALLPENVAPQWRALVLRNIGNASLNQKQNAKAIDYQQQSLKISQRIGDRYGEAQAYGNLGTIYAGGTDFAKSIDAYQRSLKIAQEIGDRLQQAQVLLGLGTTYSYQRNFATAVTYHQQSLVLMQELQARLGEGITLTNLGDAFFRLQKLGDSEKALQNGISVWESLRAGLGNNDAFKVSIFETQLSTYRNLQETLIAQNRPAPALEIAERSRARAFIELLARHRNPVQTTVPAPPTIAQIQQIAMQQKATIVQYSIIRDQFVETPHGGAAQFTSQPKETALFIWVVQPNGQVAFRRIPINSANQDSLLQLVMASRSAIGTRSDRAPKINPVQTVFKVGDFVRRQGEPMSWKPYQIATINAADKTVTLTHPEIRVPRPVPMAEIYGAENQQAQFAQLKQLHQRLIEPIADLLPTNPNDRVVFVPQEQLFLVPFAALQNSKSEFLIQKHTVSTAPAIQLLGLNSGRARPTPNPKTLIIGNPKPMPADYAPLPGSENEAKAIGNLLNVRPLIAQEATEANVKAQINQANIIHLATHGSFDENNPLQGAIALAPAGKEDGLLTAEEMLKLSLQADLVVLSACDTGRGKITGDGVLGLSRSWLAAGAPSLVVSLWEVDDNSTSELMLNFYKALQQQPDKAIALRSAMLQTMQKYPSPRDWSAFTLVGVPSNR